MSGSSVLFPKKGFKKVEYFTPGSYSWTVPVGIEEIIIVAAGGGGGGGAGNYTGTTDNASGGGGGGGDFQCETVFVIPNTTISILVGTGGTGGQTHGANGAAGTTTAIVHPGLFNMRMLGGSPGAGASSLTGGNGGVGLGRGGDGGKGGDFPSDDGTNGEETVLQLGGVRGAGNTGPSSGCGGGGGSSYGQGGTGGTFALISDPVGNALPGGNGIYGSGGGGGGRKSQGTQIIPKGGKGGDGFVIIYWKADI